MRRIPMIAVAVVVVFCGMMQLAQADDVTGEDRLLCSIAEVNFCAPGGDCANSPPWLWNVPDFIEVDLVDKELRTTKASGQNRKTPIRRFSRENGDLILGGTELGRSFVFSIHEETGGLTVSMAAWARPLATNSFGVPRPQTTPPSTSPMRTNHCWER